MSTFETPFLADRIVEELRNDVKVANANIGKDVNGQERPVDALFEKWLQSGRANQDILTISNDESLFSTSFTEQLAIISVGLVGLIRCIHVDLNEKLKVADGDNLKQLWSQYEVLQNFLQNKQLFDPNKLLPISIHGHPTFWIGELAQDRANTFAITGDLINAKGELSSAISAAKSRSSSLGVPSQKQRPFLAAIQSSQAVAEVRLGRIEEDPQLLLSGLCRQQQSMKFRPDKARLIALSEMTLKYLSEHPKQLLQLDGAICAFYATILRFLYSQ